VFRRALADEVEAKGERALLPFFSPGFESRKWAPLTLPFFALSLRYACADD